MFNDGLVIIMNVQIQMRTNRINFDWIYLIFRMYWIYFFFRVHAGYVNGVDKIAVRTIQFNALCCECQISSIIMWFFVQFSFIQFKLLMRCRKLFRRIPDKGRENERETVRNSGEKMFIPTKYFILLSTLWWVQRVKNWKCHNVKNSARRKLCK